MSVQNLDQLDRRVDELQRQGTTVMHVAVELQFAGLIAVFDPIKKSSAEAVRKLNELGMRIIVLSGSRSNRRASLWCKEIFEAS